ncbi:hypothetical protein HJC23_006563 [Cyclotella cryptica]|uniref:Uncharacterized protein n=1 Tax=Cyclotella cryptica TaxID=29204 RepID=A0ABD3PKJ4_9STRA
MKLKKTWRNRGEGEESRTTSVVGVGVGVNVESDGGGGKDGVSAKRSDSGGGYSAKSSDRGGGYSAKSDSGGVVSAKSDSGGGYSAKSSDNGGGYSAKSDSGGGYSAKSDEKKVGEKDATKSKEPTAAEPTPPVMKRWRPPAKTNDHTPPFRGKDTETRESHGPSTRGASWMLQRQQRALNDAEKHRDVTSFARGQGRREDEENEEKIHDVPEVKRVSQPQDHLLRGQTALPLSLSEVEAASDEIFDEEAGNEQSDDGDTDSESLSAVDAEQPKSTRQETDKIAAEPPNKSTMPPLFANYNTAVLAAKEAIDASNRSRGRNSNKPILTLMEPSENEVVISDPELTMEFSPDSSTKDISFFEQEEEPPTISDPNVIAQDSTECNGFEAEEYDFIHGQRNDDIFGSSFVKSSLDMFASSDDEKENKGVVAETLDGHDDFGFDSVPFFGSDPFDPFFEGGMANDKADSERGGEDMQLANAYEIGQITNFLGTTSTDGLMPSWSEESPRFDAQFPDDLDGIDNEDEDSDTFDQESSHHVDILAAESLDEAIPPPQRDVVDETVPQSRSLDSQNEETGVVAPAQNVVEEVIPATVDPSEISSSEIHTIKVQHLQSEEDEYSEDDEIVFDDNFGTFQMHPLELSFGSPSDLQRIPNPIQNPLTENLIVCRCQCGVFFIEEIDVTQKLWPTTLMSVRVVSNESMAKISRSIGASRHAKVIGVSTVLSLAAGVHRVHGHMRVRVAALMEVVITEKIAGVKRVRVVAVWKWGYNPGGRELVSLQSVLSTSGIDDGRFVYHPNTLQVTDGLLFLGGHEIFDGATEPTVFVAKPAVRNGWAPVCVRDDPGRGQNADKHLSVSTLAAINDTNTLLAIGLSDGSVSVWTYDRAVRTNRISSLISGKDAKTN